MPAPPFSLVIEIGLHSHCFGSPLNIVLSESDGVCMSIAKPWLPRFVRKHQDQDCCSSSPLPGCVCVRAGCECG